MEWVATSPAWLKATVRLASPHAGFYSGILNRDFICRALVGHMKDDSTLPGLSIMNGTAQLSFMFNNVSDSASDRFAELEDLNLNGFADTPGGLYGAVPAVHESKVS